MNHIIENDLLKVEVSELGATLVRFIDKKTSTDIVLGFESEDEYLKNTGPFFGASVGRNCNRIGKGQITIDGTMYQLSVNDGPNQLHGGGVNGFAFKMWKLVSKTDNEIKLSYFSKDGEEGFPGNLDVTVTYKLDGNNLTWNYEASCDKPTLLNMTNHSYFNLGDENILNEYLHLTADTYSLIDSNSLTQQETCKVEGTPYDFTKFTKINDNLSQLETGIDNNYVWEVLGDKLLAELKNDKLHLSVYSDLPDMHLYTAYYLNGEKGKYGNAYGKYAGICFEGQFYPNGINYNGYMVQIVRPNEKVSHYMRYELKEA